MERLDLPWKAKGEKERANLRQRAEGQPSLLLLLMGTSWLKKEGGSHQQELVMQGQAANPVSQACATNRADHRAATLSRLWLSSAANAQSQLCAKPGLRRTAKLMFLSKST